MASNVVTDDATFGTRAATLHVLPALFAWIDFPGGAVYATTHHASIVAGTQTWSGVGDIGFVEPDEATDSPVARRWRLGLRGLWLESADALAEQDNLYSDVEVYLGAFDGHFESAALTQIFAGFVSRSADIEVRRQDGGFLANVSVEVSDQFNPRRGVTYYYATGRQGSDTAVNLLHTVEKEWLWPSG